MSRLSFLLAHHSDEWNPASQKRRSWLERSATNDVDEEVYGNDGAERHEAQEASAGDRQAMGSHTFVNARRIKMPGKMAAEQHRRRRRNVELLQIQIHDHWTRVGSSMDPEPKRAKTTSVTDDEKAGWMRTTSKGHWQLLIY